MGSDSGGELQIIHRILLMTGMFQLMMNKPVTTIMLWCRILNSSRASLAYCRRRFPKARYRLPIPSRARVQTQELKVLETDILNF